MKVPRVRMHGPSNLTVWGYYGPQITETSLLHSYLKMSIAEMIRTCKRPNDSSDQCNITSRFFVNIDNVPLRGDHRHGEIPKPTANTHMGCFSCYVSYVGLDGSRKHLSVT
jgi:hypothetical protein